MQSSKLNLFQTLSIPTVLRQNTAIYDIVCTLQPKRMIFTVFCKAIAENTGIYNVLTHCMHQITVNTSKLLSLPCCFGTGNFSSFFCVFELGAASPRLAMWFRGHHRGFPVAHSESFSLLWWFAKRFGAACWRQSSCVGLNFFFRRGRGFEGFWKFQKGSFPECLHTGSETLPQKGLNIGFIYQS